MLSATPPTPTQTQPSDAELVTASRSGDREAFAQIVRRYQGMVSGLIYAACGDLHRSEDLAQETFLSAWKSLSGLREPEKLPSWLCQIARHRTQDQQRKISAEKVGVGGFWARQSETAASSSAPDAELLRKEEEVLLWNALAQIPQPYRETLVLYYRQGQSTEEVSAAMETSEASIRQRLARGRQMLREQVSEMVERNLTRSAPRSGFAMAVVAALPGLLPEAGKVAAVSTATSTAAKSSLATKSGLFAFISPSLGLIGGLAGGVAGSVGALRDDRTPIERRLTVRFLFKIWIAAAVLLVGCVTLIHLNIRLRWSDDVFIPAMAGWFTLYWAIMSTVVQRYQSRSLAVRGDRPLPNVANGGIAIFSGVGIAAGPTIGALAWMIHLALISGDHLGAAVVVALILIISLLNMRILHRSPQKVIPAATIGFCLAIVAMANWRLNSWTAALRGLDPTQLHLPLWSINLAAAALIVWVVVLYRLCYPGRDKIAA